MIGTIYTNYEEAGDRGLDVCNFQRDSHFERNKSIQKLFVSGLFYERQTSPYFSLFLFFVGESRGNEINLLLFNFFEANAL